MFLMGALPAASLVTAAVGIVVVLILLSHPPLPVPRIYALVALILASSAVAVYCYGWFVRWSSGCARRHRTATSPARCPPWPF
ncbi:hypothetical protein [Streptomyces coeruleorubidus]|jgi:hypothetical protein|uniref:hypothetical protein n=1 Tax=Streptomyces coeruleorubidus TaxID=116188 RepID=UPI0033A4F104